MSTLAPRAVLVTRRSELDELLERHGTRRAAEFYLKARGRDLGSVQHSHDALAEAVRTVSAGIPTDWRRGHVERGDLHRFLFAPEDVVIVVGQDGLVANVAKYLDGQRVGGIDPEPDRNPGVLVRHRPGDAGRLLHLRTTEQAGQAEQAEQAELVERRTMVAATTDDGQTLLALNEVYLGDRGHQSSRYLLAAPDRSPCRQSSSGLIVATGTGPPAGAPASPASAPRRPHRHRRPRRRSPGSSARPGPRRGPTPPSPPAW